MERMKTYLTLACVLIAVAAGSLAWRECMLAQRAEAALAEAETRIAALEKQIQTPKAAGVRETIVTENSQVSATGRAAPEREQSPRLGRRREPPDFTSDPEIAPLLLKQRQRQIGNRYAALFARLGLSSERREKLQALLADKQISHFDAMGLARRQGLGREEAMELARQADAESDGSIRSLIGDAAYSQLQEYDRTYAQRSTVNSLSMQLGYAGAPLSSTQQEQLITVLAEHSAIDAQAGGFGVPWGGMPRDIFGPGADQAEIRAFFESKAASDAEALRQASAFLSPAQLDAVRQAQQDETTQLQVAALRFDRMRRAQSANGGDAPPR